jgi:protein gp37
MSEITGIEWCDHTLNFWIGCSKVSPACDFCYAEAENNRRRWTTGWGSGVERYAIKSAHDAAARWNKKARETGHSPRVFCNSLSDIFDNEVPSYYQRDMIDTWRATPFLRWLPLTKRIGNARKMLPPDWPDAFPHVGMMISVCNQDEYTRDAHKLAMLPAWWRGLSIEPMLGPIMAGEYLRSFDWVICGGESGPHARPMPPDWARSLRDQCAAAGVAFFFKQWGGRDKKRAGRLLDGVTHDAFPAALSP